MYFKRTTSRSRHRCQRCATIRLFIAVSAMLIVAMPFMSDKAAPLAALTPAHFAYALMGAGSLAFLLRWIQWKRGRSSATHHTNDRSPPASNQMATKSHHHSG